MACVWQNCGVRVAGFNLADAQEFDIGSDLRQQPMIVLRSLSLALYQVPQCAPFHISGLFRVPNNEVFARANAGEPRYHFDSLPDCEVHRR